MKGINSWSYKPYKMPMYDVGEPYICRVVPSESGIHFEWLGGTEEYSVFFRIRDNGEFMLAGKTSDTCFDIVDLLPETDYELYVTYGENKSRVRLARTGKTEGTVVNYLHPDDTAYAFSGRYLCSPSLLRLPDGALLASMDLYEGSSPQNLTLIFRSDDNGITWHYQCELMPCFWGKLFLHKGEIYMLAVDTEYGSLIIGKSTDGGKSFFAPVTLLRGSNGKGSNSGVHKNPQNVLVHNGRIYESLEWKHNGKHHAMVMSIDEGLDLLNPENWHFTPPLQYNPNWEGVARGNNFDTIEGTLCVAPDGNIYDVMRYFIFDGEPKYGLTLAYKVNSDNPDAPLEYSHTCKMDCNNSKFMIKYDEVSKRYYTVASEIYDDKHIYARNLLSLFSSTDMEHWHVVKRLYDHREIAQEKGGMQYVDFYFEGDDIIFLCRTALNNAHSYHDSNYSTFHTIRNFREL